MFLLIIFRHTFFQDNFQNNVFVEDVLRSRSALSLLFLKSCSFTSLFCSPTFLSLAVKETTRIIYLIVKLLSDLNSTQFFCRFNFLFLLCLHVLSLPLNSRHVFASCICRYVFYTVSFSLFRLHFSAKDDRVSITQKKLLSDLDSTQFFCCFNFLFLLCLHILSLPLNSSHVFASCICR